jgi:hypothetical protein
MFFTNSQGSGLVEVITALSEAMPWNAISEVVVAWIYASKNPQT